MKIQEKKRTKASILLVYTGGTIGMMQDPNDLTLKPFNFKQILAEAPELGKFAYKIDSYSFNPIIDSSDVEPSLWQKLAWLISTQYSRYDGFVILHGTDTMAYSASALSFMLGNLTKPVIFTGSQLPIGAPRTDGRENLISSVEIAAAKDSDGHALVPEVCICFDNMLMRGNRATKVDSDNFRAFRSVNFPPLAEAGISIRYNTSLIRRPESWDAPLQCSQDLDTRVSILKIHPGITPQVVRNILCGDQVIYDSPVSETVQAQAEQVLRRNGVFYTIECRDGSYTDPGFKAFLREHTAEGANSELLRWREQLEQSLNILPLEEYKGQPVYKIVVMSPSMEQLKEPEAVLAKDFSICIQETDVSDGFSIRLDSGFVISVVYRYFIRRYGDGRDAFSGWSVLIDFNRIAADVLLPGNLSGKRPVAGQSIFASDISELHRSDYVADLQFPVESVRNFV